jgi:hypothetical protein
MGTKSGHIRVVPIVTLLAHARVPSPEAAETYDRDWACAASLDEALDTVWPTDVHATQYAPVEIPDTEGGEPIVVRASKEALTEGHVLRMVALFGDLDGAGHKATPEWRAEVEAKLDASGLAWYRTRNGARVVLALPDTIEIRNEHDEQAWYGFYLAFVAWAHATHDLDLDPRCKDCWHLFRLPNVLRGGKPERSEVHGEITVANLEAIVTHHAVPDTKPKSEFSSVHSDDARMARAITMAERLPPSVEGCGGDAALFHAACELETVLGNDVAAIRAALDAFNTRCLPPWPAAKLDLEASRAAARHDPVVSSYAERLAARAAAQGAPIGTPPDTSQDPATDPWHDFASFTAPEEPLEYVCEGLRLAPSRGKISIIAGYAGTSKGPLADYLAVCIALGLPVFGKHPVVQGNVLVIDEEGVRLTMRRLRRLTKGLERDPAELEGRVRVLDGGLLGDLCDAGSMASLAAVVHEHDIKTVVLDSYTTAMLPSGIDSNAPQYAALASMLGQLGVLVIAVAHARKGDPKRGAPTLEDIAGSGALAALAQTALGVWYPDQSDKNVARIACLRAPEGAFDECEVKWSGDALANEPLQVALHDPCIVHGTPKRIESLKTRIADTNTHADRVVACIASLDTMRAGVQTSKLRSHLGISGALWPHVRDELLKRGAVSEVSLPSEAHVRLRLVDTGGSVPPPRLPQPGDVAARR